MRTSHLVLGLILLASCNSSKKSTSAAKPRPTPSAVPTAPTTEPTLPPTGGSTLLLDNVEAIGRAGESGLNGTPSETLVGLSSAGVAPLLLPTDAPLSLDGEGDAAAAVKCVLGTGRRGVIVQALQRGSTTAFFKGGTTDLALIRPDGSLLPLLAAAFPGTDTSIPCDISLRHTDDGFLFALAQGRQSLWQFSLETGEGTKLVQQTPTETIDQFTPLSGGHVLFSSMAGQLRQTWWRSPAGELTDLHYPSVDISQSKSLGEKALSFSSGGRSGAMLLTPGDGKLLRSFIEPLYGTGSMTYWGAASRAEVGDWMVTGYTSLKAKDAKLASNPFWRSYGRFQSLVDASSQIYFDGSNLARITFQSSEGLKVWHQKNIVHDAASQWKVVAVFGPAQGFASPWVGFAYDEGFIASGETPHLYWIEIDPSTGRVDSDRVFRLTAPHMYSGWTSPDVIPEFTPYKVPTGGGSSQIVGLGGTLSAGLFKLTFNTSEKTATLGSQLGCAYTYEHSRALLHQEKLLFTASWYNTDLAECTNSTQNRRSIYFYDGNSDTAAAENTRISLPAEVSTLLTPPQGGRDCNAHELYGMVQLPDRTGPSVLACDIANENLTTRLAGLKLLHFSDFTFSTLASQVSLPAQVGIDSDADGDFATGTVNNTDWMQSFALPGDILALGFGRNRTIKLVNAATGNIESSLPFNELWTENRFEYSRIFGHMSNTSWQANEVDVVVPWDSTRFFASDDTAEGYRSYLVDVESRSFLHLAHLDAIQVTSAARVAEDRVLISALEGDRPITILVDNNGDRVQRDEATWLVREVAPLVKEP